MFSLVNGYVCHNCTDIENAKKGVDPAHPKKDDSLNPQTNTKNAIAGIDKTQNSPAVILGGVLASLKATDDPGAASFSAAGQSASPAAAYVSIGTQLNVSV